MFTYICRKWTVFSETVPSLCLEPLRFDIAYVCFPFAWLLNWCWRPSDATYGHCAAHRVFSPPTLEKDFSPIFLPSRKNIFAVAFCPHNISSPPSHTSSRALPRVRGGSRLRRRKERRGVTRYLCGSKRLHVALVGGLALRAVSSFGLRQMPAARKAAFAAHEQPSLRRWRRKAGNAIMVGADRRCRRGTESEEHNDEGRIDDCVRRTDRR